MTARLVALFVLMAGAATAAGAEFGRMFFTPSQRAALDHFRDLNIRNAVIGEDESDKDLVVPPPPGPERVSVNGIVRRSDGRSTVWINNRAVVGTQQPRGINVVPGKNDNSVKLTVPRSGRSFELKVGQTADTVGGTITEGYARRTLPVPEASATSSAASPPVKSTNIDGKGPARAGERDVPDDIRPHNGLERK